jgi:hypothetical protein
MCSAKELDKYTAGKNQILSIPDGNFIFEKVKKRQILLLVLFSVSLSACYRESVYNPVYEPYRVPVKYSFWLDSVYARIDTLYVVDSNQGAVTAYTAAGHSFYRYLDEGCNTCVYYKPYAYEHFGKTYTDINRPKTQITIEVTTEGFGSSSEENLPYFDVIPYAPNMYAMDIIPDTAFSGYGIYRGYGSNTTLVRYDSKKGFADIIEQDYKNTRLRHVTIQPL